MTENWDGTHRNSRMCVSMVAPIPFPDEVICVIYVVCVIQCQGSLIVIIHVLNILNQTCDLPSFVLPSWFDWVWYKVIKIYDPVFSILT